MKKVEGYISIDGKFFETEEEVLLHELDLTMYDDFKNVQYRTRDGYLVTISKNCLRSILEVVKEKYVRIPEEDLDTGEN